MSDNFRPKVVMTSWNGNIFRVTGPLCEEFTGHRWIPLTKASDAGFDVFFDLRLNKRLSKQSSRRWFETPLRSIWCHCNVVEIHFLWYFSIHICILSNLWYTIVPSHSDMASQIRWQFDCLLYNLFRITAKTPHYWPFCEVNLLVAGVLLVQRPIMRKVCPYEYVIIDWTFLFLTKYPLQII